MACGVNRTPACFILRNCSWTECLHCADVGSSYCRVQSILMQRRCKRVQCFILSYAKIVQIKQNAKHYNCFSPTTACCIVKTVGFAVILHVAGTMSGCCYRYIESVKQKRMFLHYYCLAMLQPPRHFFFHTINQTPVSIAHTKLMT